MVHGKQEKHVCSLPIVEDVLVTYISDGRLVLLRRWLKSYFVIDEKHNYTKSCFKSTFLMRREKKYHLKYYYYMIHPFSKAKRHFDILVAFFILLSTISVNNDKFTGRYHDDPFRRVCDVIDGAGDCILLTDIIRTFISGYFIRELNVTVLKPRKVAWNYIKGWLIVDMLTVCPEYLSALVSVLTHYEHNFLLIKLIEISRVVKYLRLINMINRYYKFKTYIFRAFRMLTIMVMIVVWISFAVLKMIEINGYSHVISHDFTKFHKNDHFVVIIQRSFFMFFLIGAPGQPPQDLNILFMELLLFHCVQFYQMVTLRNSAINRNELMKSRLSLYGKYKKLPDMLRYELAEDFENTFHNCYFNEPLIMSTISGEFARELREYLAEKFQKKFDLFCFMSIDVLSTLMNKMKLKTYTNNVIISRAGMEDNYIYFLYQGTVAVYSKDGAELCHLYDGTYFGEIRFITSRPRIATIIAIETCQIYRLEFSDLKQYAEEYPQLFTGIVKVASARLKK